MKKLSLQEKKGITVQLEKHLQVTNQSANKFKNSAGVSVANISNIRNHKWNNVGDAIWRKVAIACGYSFEDWTTAKTTNLLLIDATCSFAQQNSASVGISHDAGSGKTHAFSEYKNKHEEVIYIEVAYHWTRKMFFENLAKLLGIDTGGNTASMVAEMIIRRLKSMNKPLLIIDEADKLTESGMMFFITLYNQLDGSCGIVLAGAPYLKRHIEKCAKRDKRGYREINSRLGRKFTSLEPVGIHDVRAICHANGLIDEEKITEISNESEGDLRRVKRAILKEKANKQLKTA